LIMNPRFGRSSLSALRLFDLGNGKSVSEIASEFGFSKSDVVCMVVPFVGAGLAARKRVTDDWRHDIYYPLYVEKHDGLTPREEEIKRLRGDVVRFKEEIRRLEEDLVKKERLLGIAGQVESIISLNLGEGKTLSQIEKETGMDAAQIHQVIEPFAHHGMIGVKHVTRGQFFYYPVKDLGIPAHFPTEEEIRAIKMQTTRLNRGVADKEEEIRTLIKRAVLRALNLHEGKSARQIAKRVGMSVPDVVGMMMAFVRAGLVEQNFTPQGFFYTPILRSKTAEPDTTVGQGLPVTSSGMGIISTKDVTKELASHPVETHFAEISTGPSVKANQAYDAAMKHTSIEELEAQLDRLTVRELVLLRERINMELRKR